MKTTLRWLGGALVGALALAVTYDASTGWMFSLNVVRGSAFGYSLGHTLRILQDTRDWMLLARLALLAFAGLWLAKGRGQSPQMQTLGLYALLSVVVNLFQMGKEGADLHYLLEPVALSAAAAAALYTRFLSPEAGRAPRWQHLGVAAGALLLIVVPSLLDLSPNFETFRHALRDVHRVTPLEERLTIPEGALLMDEAFLDPSPLAHAIPDPYHYARMTSLGKTPRQPLLERLARRQFSMIALSPVAQEAFFVQSRDGWIGRALTESYRRLPGWEVPQIWVPR